MSWALALHATTCGGLSPDPPARNSRCPLRWAGRANLDRQCLAPMPQTPFIPPFSVINTRSRTEDEILEFLRGRGARRLRSVRLRANRSTVWSLTRGGTRLNLHRAFAVAPGTVLRQFVVIVNEGGLSSAPAREASRKALAWPPLHRDLAKIRADARRSGASASGFGVGPCCATPAQLRYLRRLYRYINRSRFGGKLPARVPLRLASRMTSRLGQMVPGEVDGRRRVLEIALNVDLMLPGNGHIRFDTLVHEMAHAADWLFDGHVGHGPTWKWWAERSGCESRACTDARILRRRRGQTVVRVPPLPLAARVGPGSGG